MAEVSGIIQKIDSRKVSNGTKTAYDIYVAGQKYGAGLWAPKAKEGDYVTFNANQSQYGFDVERGTLKVGKAPKGEVAAAASANVRAAVNSFDSRQDAISRQAASNTAIAWIVALQQAGALALPASKTKGAAQAALDTIRREYEKEFYEANTGNEWKDIRPKSSAGNEEMEFDDVDGDDAEDEDAPW